MSDPFDVTLTDGDVMAEVELMTRLIVEANTSAGRLSQGHIDSVLGLG